MDRVRGVWKTLAPEQRLAAVAAFVLLLTLFLPWYQKSLFDEKAGRFVPDALTGFGSADFVMASVVLVAFGVLVLLWARGEDRGFHLPGGDGLIVMIAGGWAALLIFYRVLDHPDVSGRGATIGIQWGVFIAFLAAAFLVYAGYRIRAAHRPEPPLPEEASTGVVAVEPRVPRARRPRPVTEVPPPPIEPPTPPEPTPRRRRPPAGPDEPPMPGQLSFDEADTRRLPDQR